MKTLLTSIAASSLLAALAIAQTPRPRYDVKDLGTLGGNGTSSFAFDMNNFGWVAGSSNLVADGPQHAFIWYGGGRLIDVGTLGGPNSAADGPNVFGELAIGSETAKLDPNGEDFCEYGSHHQCLGAIWKNGGLIALPTLPGGNNANAFAVNDLNQVVGFAENGVADSTCAPGGTPFQKFRFEAVLWTQNGQIQELPPLKGDTVGFAFGINDFGQVVGASGLCSNTSIPPNPSGPHAVIWERGFPTNLGSLGGANTVASSINNRGEVVGGAQSSKDGNVHAFLWSRQTGMRELPTLPGAVVTVAPCCRTINDRGDVVGFSINGATGTMSAVIWQNRVITDLNKLIPAGSPWFLQVAQSINDFGEIVGIGLINGAVHAFLATPR